MVRRSSQNSLSRWPREGRLFSMTLAGYRMLLGNTCAVWRHVIRDLMHALCAVITEWLVERAATRVTTCKRSIRLARVKLLTPSANPALVPAFLPFPSQESRLLRLFHPSHKITDFPLTSHTILLQPTLLQPSQQLILLLHAR